MKAALATLFALLALVPFAACGGDDAHPSTPTPSATVAPFINVCMPNPDPATPDVQIIDQPLPFASVTSPLTVSGQIVAFEATYQVAIYDVAGDPIVETFGMAEAREMGELAPFSIDVEFDLDEPIPACLWVYEASARDGSPINIGQVPLLLMSSP